MIENESKDNLVNFLQPEERLLWYGKPKTEYLMSLSEIVDNLFISIFLLICAIFVSILDKPVKSSTWVFVVIYIIWILWLIFDYFVTKLKLLRNTIYGLTDQRIMIVNNSKKEKLEVLGLEEITKMKYELKKNGVGDIDCRKYSRSIVFKYIENAENVFKQIQDAKETIAQES